jgi:hypothetical protein
MGVRPLGDGLDGTLARRVCGLADGRAQSRSQVSFEPDYPFSPLLVDWTSSEEADLAIISSRFYDSTLVVPVFYAGYTLLGFLNSTSSPSLSRVFNCRARELTCFSLPASLLTLSAMIFLDQFAAYSYTILFFLLLSIALLLSGVVLLSTKKEEPSPDAPLPSSNDPGRRDDGEDGHDAHHGGARREADDGEEATERRRAERERLRVEGGEEGRALFDAAEDEGGQFELGGSSDSEEDDRSSDKEEEKRRIEKGKVAEPLDDEVFGAWTDAGGSGSTGVAVSRRSRDEVLGGVR